MLFDEEMMLRALDLAEKAFALGEVPVGAVITDKHGDVVGTGYNRRESLGSPVLFAHAEVAAIEDAAAYFRRESQEKNTADVKSWILDECTVYVTLEPCLMCAGAIMQARLKRIVYGAFSDKSGALSSVANVYEHKFGYNPMVRGGVLERECAALMNRFGGSLR